MAADERATVAALDAARAVFRTQIEVNHGRVIDMAGDSVLAVFETAIGAVSAALAIQQELNAATSEMPDDRRMRFRIGIHMGDVIEKADGTIYGDGVNIAARLEGLADASGISVSDAVRGAVKGKISAAFEDQGEQQVKNIADPVRAFRVKAESEPAKPSPVAGEIDLSLPDKPSIAVLPFLSLSSDAEQEYFTDGITEGIITELSRFRSLFVIARNSTFTYKGKAVDVRNVARELGVRYVLEGSIQRAGNRIRVTAQLIDALSGNHIWAEKYDRVLEDIFAVQEEVTQAIVGAIAPQIEISETERVRRVRPGNFTAYEIGLRAWAAALTSMSESNPESRDKAIQLAREALTIDTGCGHALQALAYAQWQHIYYATATSVEESRDEALAACRQAIATDHGNHVAHRIYGQLLFLSGQQDTGMAEMRHAHELNPNDATTLAGLGFHEAQLGEAQKGIEYISRALRLSPRDNLRYHLFVLQGQAFFAAREYEKGADAARQSIRAASSFASAHLSLALNSVGLGDIARAKTEYQVARKMAPEYADSRLAGEWPSTDPGFCKRATIFTRIAAGLEDPDAAEAVR